MAESTTTDPSTSAAADPTAQADAPVDESAATQPAESTTTESTEAVSTDDDNLAWLSKKGVDPSSPEALSKVAEMYRNAEKAMHQSTSKASELEDAINASSAAQNAGAAESVISSLQATVNGLLIKDQVNTFFSKPDVDKTLRTKMAGLVTKQPELGQLVEAGYLSVEQLYNLTRGSDATLAAELKTEGGKEALERVAENQQARAITGAATTSAMSSGVTKGNFNEWYEGLSASDRAKPENQQIVNSLLS